MSCNIEFMAFIRQLYIKRDGLEDVCIKNQMLPVTGLHFFEGGELTSVSIDSEYGELQDIWLENPYANMELMQYTGLKDKNGTKIYKGDILKKKKLSVVVEWSEGLAGFINNPIGKNILAYPCFTKHNMGSMQIIENIYKTPELLKGVTP